MVRPSGRANVEQRLSGKAALGGEAAFPRVHDTIMISTRADEKDCSAPISAATAFHIHLTAGESSSTKRILEKTV
jgi:hypothetical protein